MESKPIYLSKTFWTNLILGVAAVAAPAELQAQITPEVLASVFVVVNVILRLLTKEEVTLY